MPEARDILHALGRIFMNEELIQKPTEQKVVSPVKSFNNPRFDYSREKTSALLWGDDSLNDLFDSAWQNLFESSCKEYISTHSPIKLIGTPDADEKKPPLSVKTNSGAKLNLLMAFNNCAIYSDNAIRKKEFKGNELKEVLKILFELSSDIKIKELKDCEENSTKHQNGVFTNDTRTTYKKRKPTQGPAMASEDSKYASAKLIVENFFTEEKIDEAAKKLGFSTEETQALKDQLCNFSVEWLHLIDFANKGNAGQTDKNLAFGTFEANTQMMVTEEIERRLMEKGEKVTVSVDAEIVKFHVPHEIKVSISADKQILPIEVSFNPFSQIQPIPECVPYLEITQKLKRKRFAETKNNKKIEVEIVTKNPNKIPLSTFFMPASKIISTNNTPTITKNNTHTNDKQTEGNVLTCLFGSSS